MKNKKSRLFLWISLSFFALTVIAVISSMIVSYYNVKTAFPNDDRRVTDELVAIAFVGVWMAVPSLGSELSFIRSVYKMLKHEPKGCIKTCYIISSLLAFIAFAFFHLFCFRLIGFVGEDGYNYAPTVLLFTQWPTCILSFILGSVPIKHTD